MNAFKCDRCGKFFERIKPVSEDGACGIYDYTITKWPVSSRPITFDLCDECKTKLVFFIKGEDMHE